MSRINEKAKCSGCGYEFYAVEMVHTISRKRGNRPICLCTRCNEQNQRYHAINEKILGTPKKNGVLCGIEFESSYSSLYARNAIFEYDFIATHDSSLRSEGEGNRYGYDGNTCEYVSPLMRGLNKASKFALTCQHLIDEGELKVNNSCGTHFHVSIDSMKNSHGVNSGKNSYMDMIRRFYHSLFIPLQNEMNRDLQKTEQVFGRLNGHYCKSIDINARPDIDRYLWINVKANNNIEFRLNKFVSGKQYQALMKMEVEMVQCIVRNFCEHFNDSNDKIDIRRYYREVNGERVVSKTKYRKHKADVAANKLVMIYRKYTNN